MPCFATTPTRWTTRSVVTTKFVDTHLQVADAEPHEAAQHEQRGEDLDPLADALVAGIHQDEDAEDDRADERRGRLGHEPPVRPEIEHDLLVLVQQFRRERHGAKLARCSAMQLVRRTRRGSPVAELVQAAVVDAEVVADLVDDGDPHHLDHLVPRSGTA